MFEVRGFCIESKILLPSSLRVPESAFTINRYADKEIKLVLWFYRMHTAHNIKWVLYGFLCEYLFLYISMPLYCYSWDVFSSFFLFLLCPSIFLLRFHLSSNSFAPVARSIAQPSSCSYAMNYESNPKCIRWNLFIRFIHTTNLAQSE